MKAKHIIRPYLSRLAPYYAAACAALLLSTGAAQLQEQTASVAVTSLKDSGPGSLREAVKRGNRRVRFSVGGEIRLKKIFEVTADNLVIDGTDAPRPGVTITGKPFALIGVRNAQLKNLRFRNSSDDNLRIIGPCLNVLVENCSSTHGGDGAIDITVSGGTNPYTYAWTGPDGFTATTQDIGALEAGDYSVVVTDNNNCDSSATFAVELTGIYGPVEGGFKAFPNPANDRIQLISSNQIQGYRVADLLGNFILTGSVTGNSATLSTAELAAGIYMIEVETVMGRYLRKITVRH